MRVVGSSSPTPPGACSPPRRAAEQEHEDGVEVGSVFDGQWTCALALCTDNGQREIRGHLLTWTHSL